MKRILFAASILLLSLLIACTQQIAGQLPDTGVSPGGSLDEIIKDKNENDSSKLISYLQSDSFMEKIRNGSTSSLIITNKADSFVSTSSLIKSSSRDAASFITNIRFANFSDEDADITIAKGEINLIFNGIITGKNVSLSTVDFEPVEELSYTIGTSTGRFTMSYTGGTASGTIEVSDSSFTFTSTPSVTAPSTAEITINDTDVEWSDNLAESITNGFGGGTGTEEDPYRIYNKNQFIHIRTLIGKMAESADNYFYFDIYSDLDFAEGDESPALPLFRGELDFNGHTLSGLTDNILNENVTEDQVKYAGPDYSGDGGVMNGLINDFLNGAIRNLEYRPEEFIFIAPYCNWSGSSSKMEIIHGDIIFDNVNVYGNFSELGNNSSLYISQAFNCDVYFIECENHANLEILTYGAAFLGGYLGNNTNAVFEGCINYGDITGAKTAIFIGNSAAIVSYDVGSVTIKNCENYGTITGYENVGYFAANAGETKVEECEWFDTSTIQTNTGNDDKHIILSDNLVAEKVTVSLDDNGAFIITNDNPDYAKFQIMGMVYANAYLNGTPNGTMGITVSTGVNTADTINGNFRRLNIIDSTSSLIGSSTVNESGYLNNPTISINGTEYYYHDSTPKNGLQYIVGSSGANYVSAPTYRLYCYTDNDYLAGILTLTDETLIN